MTKEELENLKQGNILIHAEKYECKFVCIYGDIFIVHYENEGYIDYSTKMLHQWSIKQKERETITLTEYICDFGRARFLTPDKKYLLFSNYRNKKIEIAHRGKCVKAPNARTVKVYADTLESVNGE